MHLSGSAHERGYQYGAKFAANIADLLDKQYKFFTGTAKMSRNSVQRIGAKFIPHIQSYSNEITEELKGISEGSGRRLQEIVLLTGFNEIIWSFAFSGKGPVCTSFCATGDATTNHETYVGQNNDGGFVPNLDEYNFLMKATADSGVEFLTLTIMGCPAYMGLNSKGIGLCINAVSDGDFKAGVPFTVIMREILGSKSLGDAVNAITRARRGGGMNYVIADKSGECYDIETTATGFNHIYIDKVLGHANHYLIRTNVKDDILPRIVPSTILRSNRMNRLLNKHAGSISLETCFALLADHVNDTYSICTHPDESVPLEMRWKTMDSVVMVPEKGEMWVTRDNPCRSGFKKYTLSH